MYNVIFALIPENQNVIICIARRNNIANIIKINSSTACSGDVPHSLIPQVAYRYTFHILAVNEDNGNFLKYIVFEMHGIKIV